MATIYRAFLSGVVDNNPLASGGTTLNSSGLANMPVVTAPDIMWLALDPNGTAGTPELVKVTAHTASATSCTIERGQQTSKGGGAARQHNQNTVWEHVASPDDFDELPFKKLTTTGDMLYASAANTATRLAIGSSAQVLQVVAGTPAWAQVTASSIATDAVTTGKIADGNVTLAKIAAAAYAQPATADTLAYRDASGRTQVATPVSANDAANLSYVGSSAWGGPLGLSNGWTGTLVYQRIVSTLIVEFRAVTSPGSASLTVGTLPVGYRPAFGPTYGVLMDNVGAVRRVDIGTDGVITVQAYSTSRPHYGTVVCQLSN